MFFDYIFFFETLFSPCIYLVSFNSSVSHIFTPFSIQTLFLHACATTIFDIFNSALTTRIFLPYQRLVYVNVFSFTSSYSSYKAFVFFHHSNSAYFVIKLNVFHYLFFFSFVHLYNRVFLIILWAILSTSPPLLLLLLLRGLVSLLSR